MGEDGPLRIFLLKDSYFSSNCYTFVGLNKNLKTNKG